MRQQITEKQLNELNDREKKLLEDWTFERIIKTKKNFIPLLSIGQLLEFIEEHQKTDWSIFFGKNLAFVESIHRKELFGKTPDNRDGELIDGLWELTKEILASS